MTVLKPYPEYKESGVPWLGTVPGHWGLVPNRGLVRRRKVLVGERHSDYRLLSLTNRGVIVRDISTGKGKFSADAGTSQEVRSGDLVFCLFDVPETPRTVGLSRHDGMITGAYTVFESRGRGNADYFELFYRAMDDRKLLSPLYSGLRNTIPVDRFLGTKTPQPPPDEQAAIVRLLAWTNGRTERLIRAKRRMIELLNEQKQAIIQHAVTRGLDPNVPLKPSGVDWLGLVPRQWKVVALRHRYAVDLGKMLDAKRITGAFLMPYLRNTDVQWDRINADDLPLMDIAPHERMRFVVRRGDLLVCEGGDVGRAATWDGENGLVAFQKALHRLRPRAPATDMPRFLFYVLFATAKAGAFAADGSENTIAHLTNEKLRRHRFAFPPRAEQEAIVAALDPAVTAVAAAAERAQREIDLIREYRTRLVADVVTGKLDVRHVEVPDIPEDDVLDVPEADEEDLPDDAEPAEDAEA